MEYKVSRLVIANVAQATVEVISFDFQEQEALRRFGAPLLNVGGLIEESYIRTTQTPPTLTVVGDGTGAEVTASINSETGMFESVVVTAGGAGYTTASIAVSGNSVGLGATFLVEIATTNGPITGVTVVEAGAGYVPATVQLSFTLPESRVQLNAGLVLRENFNFENSRNADLMMHAYTTHIEALLSNTMDTLLLRKAEYIGSTQKSI